MIHQVKLPKITWERLSEAVAVQMALFSYAASTNILSQYDCIQYLHNKGLDSSKPTRSLQIAEWIWNAKARYERLEGFAMGPPEEKRILVERLQREVELFLSTDQPEGVIDVFKPPEGSWQEKGANFLRQFYNELSQAKLPACLFSDPLANDFHRQDFLREFLVENKMLYVCPVCDETGSYTSSDGSIYTDIEHYFPQSRYPHLACHPYNLLPICHLCNSAIHGDKDPLQSTNSSSRLRLQDIILPYRNLSLGTVTRLNTILDNATQSATFAGLVSTVPGISYKTQIDTFARVYEIPGRWNALNDFDKVGEMLFRRMRHFLRGTYELSIGNSPESVWPVLQYALYQLVYSLHTQGDEGYKGGDFGKDPFAFAMKWLLLTILNEEGASSGLIEGDELDEQSGFQFPLLEELAYWLGQDINNKDEYISCAKMLIRMLSDVNVALDQNQVQLERSV